MAELFKRAARLIVAAPLERDYSTLSGVVTEINDLDVEFDVTKALTKDPNTAEITVYNLSATARAAFQTKGLKVVLQAGYEKTLAQIYVGDASYIDHKHDGPDWKTKIVCGDAQRAFKHARASQSFGTGTPLASVVKFATGKMGVNLGNTNQILPLMTQQYTHGYTLHGAAARELDKVLKAAGYEWSIQDGALQILRPGEALDEVVTLSPETGLVGTPEQGTGSKKGAQPVLKARSLLQPTLSPGKRVLIEGTQHAGLYRVIKVKHTGATAGADWYTDIEATAL